MISRIARISFGAIVAGIVLGHPAPAFADTPTEPVSFSQRMLVSDLTNDPGAGNPLPVTTDDIPDPSGDIRVYDEQGRPLPVQADGGPDPSGDIRVYDEHGQPLPVQADGGPDPSGDIRVYDEHGQPLPIQTNSDPDPGDGGPGTYDPQGRPLPSTPTDQNADPVSGQGTYQDAVNLEHTIENRVGSR
jgi:hypothetical protein